MRLELSRSYKKKIALSFFVIPSLILKVGLKYLVCLFIFLSRSSQKVWVREGGQGIISNQNWQSTSIYNGHRGCGPCSTPERLSFGIIETVQKRFFPSAALEIFLSFHPLDTSCHTFGPHWHTSRVTSCIDRQSPPCVLTRRN